MFFLLSVDEWFLLPIVEGEAFAGNLGMKSFCYGSSRKTFLVQIVNWEIFRANSRMRSCCWEL